MNFTKVYAGTVESIAEAEVNWANADNAEGAPDNVYATAALSAGLNPDSEPLRATVFDFSAIPDDAVISGIELGIEVKTSANTVHLDDASLVLAGAAIGDTDATNTPVSTTEAELLFGADSILWGHPIDRTVLAVSTFGFQVVAKMTAGVTATVSVDSMAIGVWWEQPAAAPIHRRKVHKWIPPSQRGRGGR